MLNRELIALSLRRHREDVWEIYEEGKTPEGTLAIPKKTPPVDYEWEMSPEVTRQALSIVRSFKDYVADVYNPAVRAGRVRRVGEREKPAQILRHEDLNIPDKIKFLRWVETDPPHVGLETDPTYWEHLDRVVQGQLADPEKKIVIAAQNIFMVEDILKRYGAAYGIARIDGQVTGWARDANGEIRRDENGRPVTAKNYERHRFQEDPNVRIMVINVRAGVGIDLSRADAWIYAQMPETFTEMYQSMARAFGPNRPDHPRETVDVIFMISKYHEGLGENLSDQDREYYEAGTVTQIHKKRLEAQQLRYQRILEGPLEAPETFWDEDESLLSEEKDGSFSPVSAAFFPDLLADFSKGRELTETRKRTLRVAARLGGLYAVADPEQKKAILDLAHDGHLLREDLTPLVQTISEISKVENFDLDDFKVLASLKGISNRYLRRRIYQALPGFLRQIYFREGETEDAGPADETAATLSGLVRDYRWGSETIPDYVLMAGLVFLRDVPDSDRRKKSFVLLAEQITQRRGNLKMRFQELLSCLAGIQAIPVDWLSFLEDEHFDLEARLALLRKLASIAPLLEGPFEEVFAGEISDFRTLAKAVEEKKPATLRSYFKKVLELEIDPEHLRELDAEQIENIYGLLTSLKRGEEEARDGERQELFRREIRRFSEILSHVFDGTYQEWRNGQRGGRRYGSRVKFMEGDEDFWHIWTEEVRVTQDTTGWERLANFVLEKRKVEERIRKSLSDLIAGIRLNGKLLEEMEGEAVFRLFENYRADPAFLGELRKRQGRLEAIRRKLFESETLTVEENEFLRSLGISLSGQRSKILQDLESEYEPGKAALLWMELGEMAARGTGDGFSTAKIEALIKRVEERTHERGISPLIESLLADLGSSVALGRGKTRRRYGNVEIIVTSDPFMIMRRGMLDPQLRNCFELDGDPKLVRSLLDDLGSRNKMLVIVKANGRYQAVAIAKIKTDKKDQTGNAAPENGEPVLFLEKILSRKDDYHFEDEILEVLRETKAVRMRQALSLAIGAGQSTANPVTLWSTGGYGEEEYSEPQFRLRKNHYLQREENGLAPDYRADGSNITTYQHEVKARLIGSSLGARATPEQAAVIREISDAFSRLSNAEGKDETIEDIMALVSDGALMARFPCPGGGNVRKPFYFGGMKNLEKVRLRITGLAEGKFRLEFFCWPEGEPEFRKTPSTVIWDGTRYVREGDDRREREAARRKMTAAFEKVEAGKTIDIGDVKALIDIKQGRLFEIFPRPGGGDFGKRIGFGAGEKLEAVRLKITGLGNGQYRLDFYYRKEGEKKIRKEPAVVIWDGTTYWTLKDLTAKRIQEAYEEIRQGGKEKEIEDVSVFVNKSDGRLKEAFPRPNGENFGGSFGFGLEGDLEKVKLKIIGMEEGRYRLEFYYRKPGELEFRSGPAVLIWDGTTYKTLRDFAVRIIRDAFVAIGGDSAKTVDVGDVSSLIDKDTGTLKKGFPGPGDYELEKPFSFGGGTNLETVRSRIIGLGEGKYRLEFTCIKKARTAAGEESPEASEKIVSVIWDGAQYVREDGMHEKKEEKTSVRDEMTGIFNAIQQGEAESGEIEDASSLFDSVMGRFLKSFPRPDGRNVSNRGVGIGIGTGTEVGKMKIIGMGKNEFRLEITYRKQGEANFRKEPAVILWNGKVYRTLKDFKVAEIRAAFGKMKDGARIRVEDVGSLINKTKKRLQKSFPAPAGGVLTDRISLNLGSDVEQVDLEIVGAEGGRLRLEFYCRREGNAGFDREPVSLVWNGTQYVRPERMGDVVYELEDDGQLEGQSLGAVPGEPAARFPSEGDASSLGRPQSGKDAALDAKLSAEIDEAEAQKKKAAASTKAQINALNSQALNQGLALSGKVVPLYLADDGTLIFTYENLMSILPNPKIGSKKKLRVFLEMLEDPEKKYTVEFFGFPEGRTATEEFIRLLKTLADETDFGNLIILSRFFTTHASSDRIASGDASYQKALHDRLSQSAISQPEATEPGLEIFDRDDEDEEDEPEELPETGAIADAEAVMDIEEAVVAPGIQESVTVPSEDFPTRFHEAIEKLGQGASFKAVAAEAGSQTPGEFLREAWQNGLDVFNAGISRGELTATEFAALVRQAIQVLDKDVSVSAIARRLGYDGPLGFMRDAWKRNANIFKLGISHESLNREEFVRLVTTVSEEFGDYAFLEIVAEKLGYETKIELMKAAWNREVDMFGLGIKRGKLTRSEFEMLVRAAVQKLGENASIKRVAELLGYARPEEFLQAALKHDLNAFECGVRMGDVTQKEWKALVKTVAEYPKADARPKSVAVELGYENAGELLKEAWRREADVFELGVTRGTMSRENFEELVAVAIAGLEKPFASLVAGRLGYDSGEEFLTEASDRKVDVFGLGVRKDERTRKELEDFLKQGVSEMGEAAALDLFAVRLGYSTGAELLEESWRLNLNIFSLGVKRGEWSPEEFSTLIGRAVQILGKRASLAWVAGRLGFDTPADFLKEAWRQRLNVFQLGVPRGKMSRETFSEVVKAAAESLKERATLETVAVRLGYDQISEFLREAWQKHENVFEDGVLRGKLTRKKFESLLETAAVELEGDCGLKTAARWLGFDSPAEFLKEGWDRKINVFEMGIPRGKLTKTQFRILVRTAREKLGPAASALEVAKWLGYETAEEFLADADKNRARLSSGKKSGPKKHSVSFRARVTGVVETLGDQASLESVSKELGFPGPEEFLAEAFEKNTKVFALGVKRGELSESEFTERVQWFAGKLGASATVEMVASWMGYEDSLALLRDAWWRGVDIFEAGAGRGELSSREFGVWVRAAAALPGPAPVVSVVGVRLGYKTPEEFLRDAWKRKVELFPLGVLREDWNAAGLKMLITEIADQTAREPTLKRVARKLGFDSVETFLVEAVKKDVNIFESGISREDISQKGFRAMIKAAVEKYGGAATFSVISAALWYDSPAGFLKDSWRKKVNVFHFDARMETGGELLRSLIRAAVKEFGARAFAETVAVNLGYGTTAKFLERAWSEGIDVFAEGVLREEYAPEALRSLVNRTVQVLGEEASLKVAAGKLGYPDAEGLVKDAEGKGVRLFEAGVLRGELNAEEYRSVLNILIEGPKGGSDLQTLALKFGYPDGSGFLEDAWRKGVDVFLMGVRRGEMKKDEFETLVKTAVKYLAGGAFLEPVSRWLGYENADELFRDAGRFETDLYALGILKEELAGGEFSERLRRLVRDSGGSVSIRIAAEKFAYRTPEEFFSNALDREVDLFQAGVIRGDLNRGEFESLIRALGRRLGEGASIENFIRPLGYPAREEFLSDLSDHGIGILDLGLGIRPDERAALEISIRKTIEEAGDGLSLKRVASELGYSDFIQFAKTAWAYGISVFELGVRVGSDLEKDELLGLVEAARMNTGGPQARAAEVAQKLGYSNYTGLFKILKRYGIRMEDLHFAKAKGGMRPGSVPPNKRWTHESLKSAFWALYEELQRSGKPVDFSYSGLTGMKRGDLYHGARDGFGSLPEALLGIFGPEIVGQHPEWNRKSKAGKKALEKITEQTKGQSLGESEETVSQQFITLEIPVSRKPVSVLFPTALVTALPALNGGISVWAEAMTIVSVFGGFVSPFYPRDISLSLTEILEPMIAFPEGEIGAPGIASPEVRFFNENGSRVSDFLRSASAGRRSNIAILMDISAIKGASPAEVQNFARMLERGDFVMILWNGMGQRVGAREKPKAISQLMKHLIPQGVRVKDIFSGSSAADIRRELPLQYRRGLLIAESGILRENFRAFEIPIELEKFGMDLEFFGKTGINKLQAVGLLREIASVENKEARCRGYSLIGADFDPSENIWSLGAGLLTFIHARYAEMQAKEEIARAA